MMVWDQGWFDTPKTFSEFFEKVLNVLLTKIGSSGIMGEWHATKWILSQAPRTHLVIILLETLSHTK
jgi:hypothetical protein